jgi:hypothetical protein
MIQPGREWIALYLAYGYAAGSVVSICVGARGMWKDTVWGFPAVWFGMFCGFYALLFWPH